MSIFVLFFIFVSASARAVCCPTRTRQNQTQNKLTAFINTYVRQATLLGQTVVGAGENFGKSLANDVKDFADDCREPMGAEVGVETAIKTSENTSVNFGKSLTNDVKDLSAGVEDDGISRFKL